MLLEKNIVLTVFQVDDNGNFDVIGEVNQYDSLIWPDKYNGYGTFELWAPIVDENAEFFKQGNVLWCGGNNAAIIEIVKSTLDEDGVKTYNVKGRTLEMLLTTRIIWGTYTATNKAVSTVMYEIVKQNCISPTNSNRIIPFLECATDTSVGGTITIQQTGGEIYDTLYSLASTYDLGFDITFDPYNKKLVFEVVQGVDRTVDQSENDPIEFATDLEDLLSSAYYSNNQDLKHVAYVQGEGEGSARVSTTAGDSTTSGLSRRELYVDARDLQSTVTDSETGEETTYTTAEYTEMLVQRGEEKLSECTTTETFECQIRVFGDVQYEYGVDYEKGDKVTIRDNELGVLVSARITEIEEDYDEEYALVLTFGYAYPTLIQKVKQIAG